MTTSSFEALLGRVLWLGVAISTVLLASGLLLFVTTTSAVANGLLHAGLLVLMGTPMMRVVLSCVEYVRERDWFFALNAFGVLIVLAATIWTAWAR